MFDLLLADYVLRKPALSTDVQVPVGYIFYCLWIDKQRPTEEREYAFQSLKYSSIDINLYCNLHFNRQLENQIGSEFFFYRELIQASSTPKAVPLTLSPQASSSGSSPPYHYPSPLVIEKEPNPYERMLLFYFILFFLLLLNLRILIAQACTQRVDKKNCSLVCHFIFVVEEKGDNEDDTVICAACFLWMKRKNMLANSATFKFKCTVSSSDFKYLAITLQKAQKQQNLGRKRLELFDKNTIKPKKRASKRKTKPNTKRSRKTEEADGDDSEESIAQEVSKSVKEMSGFQSGSSGDDSEYVG